MKLVQIIFCLNLVLSYNQAIVINPKQHKSSELNKNIPNGSMIMIKSQSKDENIQMENLDDQTTGDVSQDSVAKAMDEFKNTQDQLMKIHEMVFVKSNQPIGSLALAKVASPAKQVAVQQAPPVEPSKQPPTKVVPKEPEHREGYYSNPPSAPSQQSIATIPSKQVKSKQLVKENLKTKQESENANMFKSRFSDSVFDTKDVVKKTLDVVKQQANRKAHPFSGLYGGVNQASDLYKSIQTKVDLPSSEFHLKTPVKLSTEQKLGEQLGKAIVQKSSKSDIKSDPLLKTDRNLQELLNSVDVAAKSLSDSLNQADIQSSNKTQQTSVQSSKKSKELVPPISLVSKQYKSDKDIKMEQSKADSNSVGGLTQKTVKENNNNSSSTAKAELAKNDKVKVLPVAKMTAKPTVSQQTLSQEESEDKKKNKAQNHDVPKRKTHWFRGILNSVSNAFFKIFAIFK